jgi:hypothetical protein
MVIGPPPGSGRQATGIALMGVNTYAITNGGSGYTSPPTVVIDPPPAGGVQATATATIANGVVTGINYISQNDFFGIGYLSLPGVTLVGGGGSGATAVAVDLLLSDVNVTYGGSGYPAYAFNPGIPVTFSGGGGSGAAAVASGNCNQVGLNGMVSVRIGGRLVDLAAGSYQHVNADGSSNPFVYLATNQGGSWHLWDSKPQLASGVDIFAMDFNGASDGWIGGAVVPVSGGPATRAYVEHFDGAKWSEVGGALPAGGSVNGVSAAGDGKSWAVGVVPAGSLNIPFVLECR